MRRRRRTALNEAMHELRRPLQALVLAGSGAPLPAPALERSARLAATALERLEREVNGEPSPLSLEPLAVAPLLEATIRRWRPGVAAAGGDLSLRSKAAGAVICGDGYALAQALDNLVLNAVEHGGPAIRIEATATAGRLRISVLDSGRPRRRRPPLRLSASRWRELVGGRDRHGHGLRIVRRTAVAHGGSFGLRRWRDGAAAVLELPLPDQGPR